MLYKRLTPCWMPSPKTSDHPAAPRRSRRMSKQHKQCLFQCNSQTCSFFQFTMYPQAQSRGHGNSGGSCTHWLDGLRFCKPSKSLVCGFAPCHEILPFTDRAANKGPPTPIQVRRREILHRNSTSRDRDCSRNYPTPPTLAGPFSFLC